MEDHITDFKFTDEYDKKSGGWSAEESIEKFKQYLDKEYKMKGLGDAVENIIDSEFEEDFAEKVIQYLDS